MYQTIVRDILVTKFALPDDPTSLAADTDLYQLGITSLQTVSLMLELETRLNIRFPAQALGKEGFRSIAAIERTLVALVPPAAA
jgi:acyl carrier protein